MLTRNDKLIDLVWSPINDDEFIAYGNDLCLFKVKNTPSNDKAIKLSDEFYAEFVVNYGENSNPKQVAWYTGNDNPNLYAVSLSNYKIQLISYNTNSIKKSSQKYFEINKEFSFKQIRQCTHLAWNLFQKNILAAGFEKVRNEHSILVWDVQGNTTSPTHRFDLNSESLINCLNYTKNRLTSNSTFSNLNLATQSILSEYKQESFKPVYETGNMDTCNSLAWNPSSENQLMAGINGKYLKIFDIRSTAKVGLNVNSKYVLGFSIDSQNPVQAASFLENVTVLWDIRMFDSPVHKIDEVEPINKIQWCPSKSGQLALLTKSSVNIYTIRTLNNSLNSSIIEDEKAPIQILADKITRKGSSQTLENLKPIHKNSSLNPNAQTQQTQNVLTNFCWFNFDSNKLLVTYNFMISNLRTLCLFDTIALSWAPNGDLYWSSNLGKMNLIENFSINGFNYLNELKERSKSDYGLKYYIINNINGNATMTHSVNNGSSNTSANGCQLTPLAVTLHSQIGLNHLIRSDFINNYKICDCSIESECKTNLKFLWNWFESVNNFFEKTIPVNPRNNSIEISHICRNNLSDLYPTRYCGLKMHLNDLESIFKESNVRKLDLNDLKDIRKERFKAIAFNLCNWEIKNGYLSQNFFSNLKKTNEFERACCLALLTENYEQALDILDSASQNNSCYGSMWIALRYFIDDQKIYENFRRNSGEHNSSGSFDDSLSNSFTSNQTAQTSNKNFSSINSSDSSNTGKTKSSLNASMTESFVKECNTLIQDFTHPYLKALFNFLINKEKSLMDILFDRNILFQDRVALSVHFMLESNNITDLQNYFDKLIEECIKYSDLSGILLTGLSQKSIDLFQAFIDKTGDLQSVCLAIIHSPYLDVLESDQVAYWIDSFREQLNKFKFWEKRAEFDLLKMKLKKYQVIKNLPKISTPNQTHYNNTTLFYCCNKCGKNITERSPSSASVFSSNNNFFFQTNNVKTQIYDESLNGCLNCSNYLPQCVVCLRLMKINLNSNPISSQIPSSSNSLARSQTTPKISHANNQTKKLSVQYKSPGQIDLVSNRNFHLQEIGEHYVPENRKDFKLHSHQKESIEISNNTNKLELICTDDINYIKSYRFGNWFSWCQSCHHGGHIKHLISWFKTNKKCPYLNCKCNCIDLDYLI